MKAQHDGFGNKMWVDDPNRGKITFTFDVVGNEVRSSLFFPPSIFPLIFIITLSQLSRTNVLGHTQTFKYDLIGRLTARSNKTQTAVFQYNHFGKMSNVTVGVCIFCIFFLSYFFLIFFFQASIESYTYDSLGSLCCVYCVCVCVACVM